MDFFFNSLRKLLTLALFTAFALVFTYVPQQYGAYQNVPQAEAQGPLSSGLLSIIATNTGITAGNTTRETVKETLTDRIAWVVAKSVISAMVASTIDWINSGFQGSPAFVRDLDRFLLNVADQVAGTYLQELGGPLSFLCSPFRLDIQVALALEYQQARERVPYQGCLLSESFENFEDFVQGDFLQGGWNDFVQITAEPDRYTAYGARLAAQRAFLDELTAAEQNQRAELDYGQGFLSFKTCVDVAGPNGQVVQECKINTPGKTIATRLSDSLGLGEDSLVTADEFNEILSALISQVAVQALTGTAGLLGLSANTGYSPIGFNGSYSDGIRQEATLDEQEAVDDAALQMPDILDIQEDYRTLATQYNARARTALQNTNLSPSVRSDLQGVINSSAEIITNTNRYIIEISADLAAYNILSAEYDSATPARKTEILAEQQELVLSVLNGPYYSRGQVDASANIWEGALAQI